MLEDNQKLAVDEVADHLEIYQEMRLRAQVRAWVFAHTKGLATWVGAILGAVAVMQTLGVWQMITELLS